MSRQISAAQGKSRPDLIFCATGKSGLGHLRRITNIVTALRRLRQDVAVHLISNAEVRGLSGEESNAFAAVHMIERSAMAAAAQHFGPSPIIVDTAVLPGLEKAQVPLCLVLRETVTARISEFNLPGNRPWDLVCVPNPVSHWMPPRGTLKAKQIAATGWIFRNASAPPPQRLRIVSEERSVLVASGGGGNAQTASWYKQEVDGIIERARRVADAPFRVVQVVGPRLDPEALLTQADAHVEVGSRLNEEFARHDAVISTVGYNSVLELAQTDVPVLLVPILRSLDDQAARARGWAPSIGFVHEKDDLNASSRWLVNAIQSSHRRAPCMLNEDGAEICARLILNMLR
jgi:predicted glycosyltransferase